MSLAQAAFLGVLQGLTEFIPVSSSGHLVLTERMFGWTAGGLSFDVAVHVGTLVALLIYFRREWVAVIAGFFRSLGVRPSRWDFQMRLAWMLVLATVPAAVAGALAGDIVERYLRTPAAVAAMLFAGGAVMLAAERMGRLARGFEELGAVDAAVVGATQVLALAPGVSRSGITISAGMFSGLKREAAARFAFLLSAPVIAGAGLWEGAKLASDGMPPGTAGAFIVGMVTAASVGFLAIWFLLGYFKRGTLGPFILYRFALATAVLLFIALN